MAKVVADISVSLDGYVTGPGAGPEQGLGTGGEPIHAWVMATDSPVDAEVLRSSLDNTGAVVMGRRLFDVIDGPHGWNDEEMGYGAGKNQATSGPPVFVVTHQPPTRWRLGPRFRFVTSLEDAVEAAREAAGDKEVVIMGGGDVVRQSVLAGLADELRLHLSPVLVGGGTPLFDPAAGLAEGTLPMSLRQTAVVVSPYATHLTYVVEKPTNG
jgi:dihydrofolate reductase